MPFLVFRRPNQQNISILFVSSSYITRFSSLSILFPLFSLFAMAVVLGNLALALDVTSLRTQVGDRKNHPVPADVVFSLFKKEPHHDISLATANTFESDKESRKQKIGTRGKANSKVNATNFASISDNDSNGYGNGNGYEEEEEEEETFDWEKEMRRRTKEIEEMRELERKAEELQTRMENEEGEDNEGTEEEKRMRVRKELEKVRF